MSLMNIDIGSAMRRLADRRIEEAMREGKFSGLSGEGKPLDLEPMPTQEDARLLWWALRILRQNDVTPDEVRLRKALDGVRDRLSRLTDERHLEPLIAQADTLVRRINTLGTNALPAPVVPLDLLHERWRLRQRTGARAAHDVSDARPPAAPPANPTEIL